MTASILARVPWAKFFLLWFLAIVMGTSLLWLHWGFTSNLLPPLLGLSLAAGLFLLWATSHPRWQKAYCSWCGTRVKAHSTRLDEAGKGWVYRYPCEACGHVTEKLITLDR